MEKKQQKKRKIKILPIFIIILISLILLGIAYLLSLIPIQNVYISGNHYLTDQEIMELAGIQDYPSFLKTTIYSINKKLEQNDYIKKAKITKKLPSEVHITIEEEKILFRREETQKIVLENKKELDDHFRYLVPVLLNYVPDTKYNSFLKRMSQVTENIKSLISEIRYYPNEQDEDRFLLYMNDGNYVYLTLTKFTQVNYYEEVLKTLEGKKGILYLDSGNHFQIMEG